MKTFSLLVMLLLQLLLVKGTLSAASPTVLFTTTNISSRVSPTGSLAGGTIVYIFGTNFSPDPTQVSVAFGPYPCALVGGSSSTSMLACTTAPASSPSLLYNLALTVIIQGRTPVYCSSSNCVFSYSYYKTPVVQQLIPRSVSNGDTLYSFGLHRITDPGDSRSTSVGQIRSLQINGYTCSLIDVTQEESINPDGRDYIACSVVSGDKAGEYNFTETVYPGTANSSVRTYQTSGLTGNTYQVRLLGKVTQDFPHQGGYNGQKLALTFTGASPRPKDYTCTIAGQDCVVSSVDPSINTVYVEVPKYSPSNVAYGVLPQHANDTTTQINPFLGTNGFKYSRYALDLYKTLPDWVDCFRAGNIGITVLQSQKIRTQLGSAEVYGQNYVEYMHGYLFIPRAGNYTFYGLADDQLIVNLALYPANSNPTNMQTIIRHDSYIYDHYNPYVNGQEKRFEREFLASGYYYMEVVSVNFASGGYFKVGMEVPNNTAATPSNPTWQIDYFSIKQADMVSEIISVTVDNSKLGSTTFKLFYYVSSAGVLTLKQSRFISPNASAQAFSSALWSLSPLADYNPTVSLNMYTSSKAPTLSATTAVFYQYLITIRRWRDTASAATTTLPFVDTPIKPSVTITLKQAHSAPISGTFKLFINEKGVGLDNAYNIPFDVYDGSLASAINNIYRSNQIQVRQVMSTYKKDSLQFVVEYFGVTSVNQIKFDTTGLTGGPNSRFNTNYTVIRKYSTDLLYDPIPYEFLRTAEPTPQLSLTVNKIPVLCSNCAYSFNQNLFLNVTSVKLAGYSLTFQMSNPNSVSYTLSDIQVTFLGRPCGAQSGNITNFVCYFLNDTNGNSLIPSGTGIPVVHVKNVGYAHTESLLPITVAIFFSSFAPTVTGPDGNIAASVIGSGFPLDNSNGQVIISLCGNRVTNYTSFSNNRIYFLIPPQGSLCNNNPSSISINSQVYALTFNYDATISPLVASLSLSSASPITKQTLHITGSNFNTMPNIAVFLYDAQGVQKYELTMINGTSTQIYCILGGGKTGDYYVRVINKGNTGTAISYQSPASFFQYKIFVNSVTPSSGPMGGGYNIIISGLNFASLDSTNVFVGDALDSLCTIISITSTQIVCTVPSMDDSYNAGVPLNVVVTGRAVEESHCNSCAFTFDASISNNVTVLAATNFNSGDTITINGSDLTGGKVFVDGEQVPSYNSTSTSITFYYPALTAGSYYIQVMTANGFAYPPLPSTTSLWLSNGISRSAGSYAGHILTVAGNGMSTTIDDGNTFSMKCPTGGIFPIRRINATANKHAFYIPMNPGTADQYCTVNITQSSNTVFRNYGFSFSGYLTNVTMAKLTPSTNNTFYLLKTNSSSTVFETAWAEVLDSNNNPTSSVYPFTISNFNASTYLLTPPSNYLPSGTLRIRAHSFMSGIAIITGENVTIAMANAPIGSTLTASYLGGATMALTGYGFIDVNPSNNKITVCGMQAKISLATSTTLVFTVPPLITAQTQSLYGLGTPTTITGTPFGDYAPNINFATDNNTNSIYSSNVSSCYVGVDFGQDTQANISSISYMGNPNWAITSNMIMGAIFQGSNDQTNWKTIFTIDNTVHMGWNYWQNNNLGAVVYRYVRFSHNTTSQCQIAQLKFVGQIYSTLPVNPSGVTPCSVQLILPKNTITVSSANVQYSAASTSTISSISPPFGPSIGGTVISVAGTNFGTTVSIKIDDITCSIITKTSTLVTCTTGLRSKPPTGGNSFFMVNDGNPAILASSPFLYIDRWSEQSTWGGEAIPREGDSVYVPTGMTLLVDMSTPKLFSVIVDGGSIIFSDEQDMTFDASYFLLNGGEFRAGTPSAPYQHKLTFTLYGDYYDRQLPTFGNKMIGCKNCKFNMHGIPRNPTWTDLDATILPGGVTLHLTQPVDWKVGESIAVAATGFNHLESQERIIASKTSNNKTLTVTVPFNFRHFSGIQTYGGKDFYMRAEVALLTRNIVMQGDQVSNTTRYGSHLMFNGKAASGLDATLSYSEFRNCGQPKIVGRYCTHFHMAGEVPNSFVRGISVHNSYARVLTIHGTHYLLVEKNVGYRVQGHNIFIQDGIETKNVIQDNLMISSITSFTMMQSDITVASYWITNPFNTVIRNRAAGGDFYGFWYEIKPNPDGPSATYDVCPVGLPLGLSRDNIAHSNKRFGLRIFKLSSRKFPCLPTKDQSQIDPYITNPAIHSTFSNYTLWKNQQCGFLGEQLGYTTIEDFKTIDSVKGGMQFHKTNFTKELVVATDSVIVGYSQGNPPVDLDIEYENARGLIAARTDGLLVQNVQFINFGPTMTPLQSCSECFDFRLWVTGAKTTMFKNITYKNISGNYIFWQKWRRQIFMDLDGSLTAPIAQNLSLGPQKGGSITPYRPSLLVPTHCHNISGALWDNAVYCDDTQTLRGILFTHAIPAIDFSAIDIRVHLLTEPYENFTAENLTDFDFSKEPMIIIKKMSMDIPHSWAMPFATGNYYNVHWKQGVDFTNLLIAPSRLWQAKDGVVLRFNYSDYRELYEIGKWYQNTAQFPYISASDTLITPNTCANGDYYHDTNNSFLFICISGRNKTLQEWIDVTGIRCLNACPQDLVGVNRENFTRYWSDVKNWPNNTLPKEGDNVTIQDAWNMVLDCPTPIFNYVDVKGYLIFDQTQDLLFQAHYIWVKGKIKIGTQANPYKYNATIVLHGEKDSPYMVIDQGASGNKMMVVTGGLEFYGAVSDNTWNRLTGIAPKKATSITVQDTTGWKVGDKLVIGASYSGTDESQNVTIKAINGNQVTFAPPLKYEHYGDSKTTISNSVNTLDTRSGVGLLSRNIRITKGPDANGWGCRVFIYSYMEMPATIAPGSVPSLKTGYATLDGVEFDSCAQYDTTYAGLRIQKLGNLSNTINITSITRSSFHNCVGMCVYIDSSDNITFDKNVFYWARKFLVLVFLVDNYNFTHNLLTAARSREELNLAGTMVTDDVACYEQYTQIDHAKANMSVSNNVAQGCMGEGFVFPFSPCRYLDNYRFANNTAGSCIISFMIDRLAGEACIGAAGLIGYASQIGLMANPPGSQTELIYKNMMFTDCERGITLRYAHQYDENTVYVKDSYFAGYSRPNCTSCYSAETTKYCQGGYAVRMVSTTISGETFPLVKKLTVFDVICTQEAFDSKSFFNNVVFQNYQYDNPSLPFCSKMSVFKRHNLASDQTGSAYLTNTTCMNCDKQAWAYFDAPNPQWFGWFGGCGELDCTGPNNYFIHDQDGSFTGSKSQILANNSMIGNNESACTFIPEINGHHCLFEKLAVMQYESIAADFNKRIMWPVYLKYDGGSWTSVTNGWRQWQWDGPEPLNLRLARFWSVVKLHEHYNLTYSSSPPTDSRFQLQKRLMPDGNPLDWVIVRIYYPIPNSLQVLITDNTVTDKIIKPFPAVEGVWQSLANHTGVCGANNFYFNNGTIEFVLNGVNSCQVRVKLSNYIQVTARLTVTVSNFYSNNGPTTFLTNICAFLGIDPGRIKIVSVRSGSTQVNFFIISTPSASNSTTGTNATGSSTGSGSSAAASADLNAIAAALSNGISNTSLNLGFPVIDYNMNVAVFNPDGTVYRPDDSKKTSLIILILATTIPFTLLVFGVITWICLRRMRSKIHAHDILGMHSSQMDIGEKKSQEENLQNLQDLHPEQNNEKFEIEVVDFNA